MSSDKGYIIGLNSGSSFDGVDAVLCTISLALDGHPTPPVFVDGLTIEWPPELQMQVLRAFDNDLTIFELTRLNYAAGALYAEAVNALLAKTGLSSSDVDVVGYDGQTIYQEPPDHGRGRAYLSSGNTSLVDRWLRGGFPCGLYIAESGVVAALADIDVVTQFRPVDHALGGSAAPLMQYLDFVLFRHESGPTATLNIGGIANIQLADADRTKMMAFDTGPGNVMLDHVAKARTGKGYDKDGELAARGIVMKALLWRLLQHDFFARKPPRSAWRLDFGAAFAEKILEEYASSLTEDLLATLTEFTVQSITMSLVDHILPRAAVSRLIVSGGGTRNVTLVKRLREDLAEHGVGLLSSDEIGIPAVYKEAVKFATLAYANKRALANNIPAAGGAVKYAVLGKLTLAPRRAKNSGEVIVCDDHVLGLEI